MAAVSGKRIASIARAVRMMEALQFIGAAAERQSPAAPPTSSRYATYAGDRGAAPLPTGLGCANSLCYLRRPRAGLFSSPVRKSLMDDQTTKHVLEGRELIEYLVERAAQDAKAALVDLEERRKKRVGLIMSVIALVGVGSIVSALKIFVRGEMDVVHEQMNAAVAALDQRVEKAGGVLRDDLLKSVEAAVLVQMNKEIGEVRKKLEDNEAFERYAELATRLPEKLDGSTERGDKYLVETLRETLEAAEVMAAMPDIARRPRFLLATRQVVDVMSRFSRETEINRLDDLLGPAMATDQELARILVDHYGELIIGSPQPIEAHADNMVRLNRYMQAARELNYPERWLLWELFVEFKRNNHQKSPAVYGLLQSSTDLPDANRTKFWFQFYRYTSWVNWMRRSDQQSRELERLTAALQEHYPEVRTVVLQVAENEELLAQLPPAARENAAVLQQQTREEQAAIEAADSTPAIETSDGSNALRK
jgi:hypothetical protein